MTDKELEELLSDCPTLYHMAQQGSWTSIRKRGLFSTSALLDLYGIKGEERYRIERQRRPANVTLSSAGMSDAVVRDQIPMDDVGLLRALPKHITPADWYRLLNGKVFFWLTRERLRTLLNAGAYRDKPHDVIEVNARSLIKAYRDSIWFCPINSGCTKPFPHPRNENTFCRIADYPYAERRRKKKKGERVVELAVDHSVPDIYRFVMRAIEMQGDKVLRTLK